MKVGVDMLEMLNEKLIKSSGGGRVSVLQPVNDGSVV